MCDALNFPALFQHHHLIEVKLQRKNALNHENGYDQAPVLTIFLKCLYTLEIFSGAIFIFIIIHS